MNSDNRLAEIEDAIASASKPPVEQWQQGQTPGTIDIRIDAQGNWFHEGEAIARMALVQLFSSILWCDYDHTTISSAPNYSLVTPVEKLCIDVDDVPFIINQAELLDKQWIVTTNVGDIVTIDAEHPVELREYHQVYLPYVKIRYDLWARVSRHVYLQWVDAVLDTADIDDSVAQMLTLNSKDYTFPVAKIAA